VKCTCELVIIVYNVKEVSWTGSYGRWMYSIQHNVIKFVSDLRQVGSSVPSTKKTDLHDIAEILLKGVKHRMQRKP
jgi:hypothetical protein